MRLVAVAYVLFAVLLFSVSFPFMIAASRSSRTRSSSRPRSACCRPP